MTCTAVVCFGQNVPAETAASDTPVRLVLDGAHFTVQNAFDILDADSVGVRPAPAAVAAMRRTRDGAIAALRT